MMTFLTIAMLMGCSPGSARSGDMLSGQRPSDFTLGLVVFGDEGAQSSATRSARYIIEPGGEFRASFGAGSESLTYPPITRMLDNQAIETAWTMVHSLDLEQEPWQYVRAPEVEHLERGSSQGYLLELRSGVHYRSWSTPIDTDSARSLAQWLASLAWVAD